MNQSLNRRDDDLISRLGNGLTRWVLGWGFLTFHATIFTISMIGMMLWNFYDSPNDIWVDEVFRRWGAVLAFHAIAVAAGLTAWRLISAEQRALRAEDEVPWQTPLQPQAPALSAQTAQVGWAQPIAPDAPAPPSTARRAFVRVQAADAAFGRALGDAASWSTDLAKSTGQFVSAGTTGLVSRFKRSPASAAPDPAQTWPVSPVQHRPEDEEFISRFGGNGQVEGTGQAVDLVLDASGYSTDADRRAGNVTVTKDPAQTWVQAATYSWYSPPAPAAPNGTAASQNGHVAPSPDTPSSDH